MFLYNFMKRYLIFFKKVANFNFLFHKEGETTTTTCNSGRGTYLPLLFFEIKEILYS